MGPNGKLETLAKEWSLADVVHFSAYGRTFPSCLLIDVVVPSSHMEANPVPILEAMAAETGGCYRVGSVPETVLLKVRHGYPIAPGNARELADRVGSISRSRARPWLGCC